MNPLTLYSIHNFYHFVVQGLFSPRSAQFFFIPAFHRDGSICLENQKKDLAAWARSGRAAYLLFGMSFLICAKASAQECTIEAAYLYISANQWNKAVQTYNFSRPFVSERQPSLQQGINASASYLFTSPERLKHGINLSYSYFRSSTENANLANDLYLHLIGLGYVVHYQQNSEKNGLYTDLIVSAVSSGLFRNVNGEPFEYDGTKSKALGIGGEISVKSGYYFKMKNQFFLSPFIGLGYAPYFYSPKTEAVINQTSNLASKNWTGLLTMKIGVAFHIR